jgi:adenylate cyclase
MAGVVERKLTTIMCADVSGYSRLMEADEAGTLATLKLYRDAMGGMIERHRGRLVSTSGDSLLADFPSVVEAVQCAIEIQRELVNRNRSVADARRMQFRIGINLGDVMVEGGDLYGEGVNVAARLEALAEPGGICISRSVYDQVRNRLTVGYDFIGEQSVKNISEPVPVYRVQFDGAARGDRRKPDRSHPLPIGDPTGSDQARRIRTLRKRTIRGGFLIAVLFMIDLLAPGRIWWFQWPSLWIAAFLAWSALKAYYPDLVGADGHGRQKIGGDATFSRDTKFRGKIDGNVVVARGVHLELTGNVGGDLTIERGAVAEVNGKIGGDVVNRGGTLRLAGRLDGKLREEEGLVSPAATDGEHAHPRRS